MSAATAILAGRRAAERLMVDACIIRRRAGSTTDPTTGQVVYDWAVVYEGRCRVQQHDRTSPSASEQVGDAARLLQRIDLQLPMAGTDGIAAGDVATPTTATLDADLAGVDFTVHDVGRKTHATARRIGCTEVTS